MNSNANDFYEILGVERDASIKEIKSAYREKAKKVHPDVNNNDDKEFVNLSKAYHVLSNIERRDNYDKLGYDGDEKLDINKLSINMIQNLFLQFLSHNEVIFETQDIFQHIRNMIKNTTLEQNNIINKAKKRKKFLDKVKNKIKYKKNKDKDNFIIKVIKLEINNLENQIKSIKFQISINNNSLKILEDYSYELNVNSFLNISINTQTNIRSFDIPTCS